MLYDPPQIPKVYIKSRSSHKVAEIQLSDVLAGLNHFLILEREIKKKWGPSALLRHG